VAKGFDVSRRPTTSFGPLHSEREDIPPGRSAYGSREPDNCEKVFAVFPKLEARSVQRDGSLSGWGKQQMLAIGPGSHVEDLGFAAGRRAFARVTPIVVPRASSHRSKGLREAGLALVVATSFTSCQFWPRVLGSTADPEKGKIGCNETGTSYELFAGAPSTGRRRNVRHQGEGTHGTISHSSDVGGKEPGGCGSYGQPRWHSPLWS